MKTLVISDVHANIVALEAVWSREGDADVILCAGDTVDCGPCPAECVEWMIEQHVRAVSGGHDRSVIQAYDDGAANAPGTDNARKLGPHHIEYLRGLPTEMILDVEGDTYGITHSYRGYEIIQSAEAFERFSVKRFGARLPAMILGHTHLRAVCYLSDHAFWLNPGSVSYRHDHEHYRGAHYAVVQDGNISLRAVP